MRRPIDWLQGAEAIETERGWPPRSGKVVLLLALSRLADHYGLTRRLSGEVGERPGPARIRHWGADGYRPGSVRIGDEESARAIAEERRPPWRTTH